ncbi:MAG: hypothetical protein CVU09_13005 [Bacteroidetes bacterium HGW-Bacteroidetes-4]|nr:MAG: hypothetical protein CVU09_13005 [Bacteroidetes bacterium HGW-Bacteroidetes-4]
MGDFRIINTRTNGILAYERIHGKQKIHILLNFSSFTKKFVQIDYSKWDILLSTHLNTKKAVNTVISSLRPFEGVVLKS